MHLRFDSPLLGRIFYFGLGTAIVVYVDRPVDDAHLDRQRATSSSTTRPPVHPGDRRGAPPMTGGWLLAAAT